MDDSPCHENNILSRFLAPLGDFASDGKFNITFMTMKKWKIWGFVNGVKFKVMQPKDEAEQNTYHTGTIFYTTISEQPKHIDKCCIR